MCLSQASPVSRAPSPMVTEFIGVFVVLLRAAVSNMGEQLVSRVFENIQFLGFIPRPLK